ncbi:MAG: radical SAM protein [Methanotrichaceae archaeon]|nr:radical SAM protein [Methanotrichaceae archaeon]
METTTRCNLKCLMCPGRDSESSAFGHMDDFLWNRILEFVPNVKWVIMHGIGEPLIHPKFLQRLQQLDKTGVRYVFSTNGTLLKNNTIEILAGLRNLGNINVSLDSPDPLIYQRIRGVDLEDTLSGLAALLKALKNPEIVSVSAVVMKCNLQSLVDFPKFLSDLGCRKLMLQSLGTADPELGDAESLDPRELQNALADIKQNCLKYGIILDVNPYLLAFSEGNQKIHGDIASKREMSEYATKQCLSPWQSPFITKEGGVYACCASDPRYEMGDLRIDSLKEIWLGDRFNEFRRGLIDGQNMPDICRNCPNATTGVHPLRGKWKEPRLGVIERIRGLLYS